MLRLRVRGAPFSTRSTVKVNFFPGATETFSSMSWNFSTGAPSIATTRSPVFRPATCGGGGVRKSFSE